MRVVGMLALCLGMLSALPAHAGFWEQTTGDHALAARERLRVLGGTYAHLGLDTVRRSRYVPEYLKTGSMQLENLRLAPLGKGPLVERLGSARALQSQHENMRRFVHEIRMAQTSRPATPIARMTGSAGGIRLHARLK